MIAHLRSFNNNTGNSGQSQIVNDDKEGMNISIIETMQLDDYLDKNGIASTSIDCIWMDAEGYESKILEGSMKTLKGKKIPLLQEANPVDYLEQNMLLSYCENISQIYDFLMNMIAKNEEQTDLFFF